MRHTKHTILWASLCIIGCGGGELVEQPPAAGPIQPMSQSTEGYYLVFQSGARIPTAAESRLRVPVAYLHGDRQPIEGAEVSFWLQGAPNTARLLATTGTTNAQGFATAEILVGRGPVSFQLAANAYMANDVVVAVDVAAPVVEPEPEPEPEPQVPDVSGRYEVSSVYDLSDRFGGSADRIRDLGRAFENPGAFLAGFVDIGGFVGALVEGILADLINQMIAERAPAWMQGVIHIGDDILGLVTNLRVRSELVIAKVKEDGSFEAHHRWRGMVFNWSLGCPLNAEGCGERELPVPETVLGASLAGSVDLDGRISLGTHPVDVSLAPLLLTVVRQVVLPARTGHDSFGPLLYDLVDCDNLGDRVERSIGIPLTSAIAAAGCRSGLNSAGEWLERELAEALHLDLGVQSGASQMLDTNRDGTHERMAGGTWEGLSGTFTADRQGR